MQSVDVLALGELLFDAVPVGGGETGSLTYEMNPGGAPANVVCALTRLGRTAAYITKVGQDGLGRQLIRTMAAEGVDVSGICIDKKTPTTLAMVHLSPQGDRSFSFYRNPGADINLTCQEVEPSLFDRAKIFHFGAVSLTGEPARGATLFAKETARRKGLLLSYDPNLRLPLWESPEDARKWILEGMRGVDICKLSGEEVEFLTGKRPEDGYEELQDAAGVRLMVVTLGAAGCFYRCGEFTGRTDAYDVDVVDTTGAGDCFVGALLSRLAVRPLEEISADEFADIMDFCSAASSVATTKRGGVPAMPTPEQVAACRRDVPLLKLGGN